MDGVRRKTHSVKIKEEKTEHSPAVEHHRVRHTKIEHDEPEQESAHTREERIAHSPFFKKPGTHAPAHVFEHPKPRTSKSNLWFVKALAVGSILGVFGLGAMTYMASATIIITPFSEKGAIDVDFTATKESSAEGLTFKFMSLTEEKTKEVPATTEQKIQKKASGKVLIYNSYSKDSQRLIKNTRLETPDHKIYRIDQSVVVPGAKVVSGKVTDPGVVEAVVYADAPGEEYNIGLADFTIPGFAGDPRYSKFSARSKQDSPIAGGFSGTVKVPQEADVVKAQAELRESLKSIALEKASAEIPEGVTFFPESVILKFEDVPQSYSKDTDSKVVVRATVSVFFFDTNTLSKHIAKTGLKQATDIPLTVTNLKDLQFAFVDAVDSLVLGDITKIRFHLKGEPEFVGVVNTKAIQEGLAGKNKKELTSVVEKDSAIKKASMTIFPFWSNSFPGDVKRITVKVIPE